MPVDYVNYQLLGVKMGSFRFRLTGKQMMQLETKMSLRFFLTRAGFCLLIASVSFAVGSIAGTGLLFCSSAQAQVTGMTPTAPRGDSNPLPQTGYYNVFPEFYQGEYSRAIRRYRSLLRGAYQDVDGPFLDSVCYMTMLGECYYHAGDYASAIELYESAIKIYISRSLWEPRTQIPPKISPDNTAVAQARVNWYRSTRTTQIGNFPVHFSYVFGRNDNGRVMQEGGVVQNPVARPVDMREAMRCTALALYRRRQIKGPLAKYDPLSKQIEKALTKQRLNNSTLVGTWKGVLAGLAFSSNEEWNKAATLLANSLQLGGAYDHPLTPIALLELGNISFQAGKLDDAIKFYLEASHSAAVHQQYDLIEHSLRQAATAYQVEEKSTVFEPLGNAIQWAQREDANFLEASLSIELAYNLAELGQGKQAIQMLAAAERPMARNDIGSSTVNARMWFVSALTKFQAGNATAGAADFARFLKQYREQGCLWIYQLALADALVVSGRANNRDADKLYSVMLRQPGELDWQAQPMETLTYELTNHIDPMERWFNILMDQRKIEKAIDVSQRLNQHRFNFQLPFGGRLMSFRWILESPESTLTEDTLKLRKQLVNRFPAYQQLQQRTRTLRQELLGMAVQPAAEADQLKQQNMLNQLEQTATAQETLLSGLALMRLESPTLFPPTMDFDNIQAGLEEDEIAIYCVQAQKSLHVFLISRDAYAHQGALSANQAASGVARLLRDLGCVNETSAVSVELLQGDAWRENAAKLADFLLARRDARSWANFKKLVVIPAGATWYLPWELLLVPGDAEGQRVALGEILDIRYAPVLGLVAPFDETTRTYQRKLAVVGSIYPRAELAASEAAFDQLKAAHADAGKIERKANGPANALASIVDQLIIWSYFKERPGYSQVPLQVDAGKPGSTLGDWLRLPWQTPQTVVMPGFSSRGSAAKPGGLDGNDLFVTTLSLMAGGSKTILISRWNVGGATPIDLSREFAMQQPAEGAIAAWKRSKLIGLGGELAIESEPRIKQEDLDQPLKAEHPFFWSGYMLVDSGPPRKRPEPVEDDKEKENEKGEQ